MKRVLCVLLTCLGLCACSLSPNNRGEFAADRASDTSSAVEECEPEEEHPSPTPAAEPFVFTVTVRSGETLRALARDFYDDAELYSRIYEANCGVIGEDPNLIYVGQVFVLPDLADSGPLPRVNPGGAYRVKSARQLALLRNAVNSGNAAYTAASVRLAADFNLAAECARPGGWEPIGTEAYPYTGVLDGAGHSVTGLVISRGGAGHQGLVGFAPKGTVQNLNVSDCRVTGGNNTGAVAALIGEIKNCVSSGEVSGGNGTGGVAGTCTVLAESCSFNGAVEGNYLFTGGVVGSAAEVRACRAKVDVIGKQATGGVAGGASGAVTDCSAAGTVTAVTVTSEENNASCAGGIVGICSADVTDCDFDGSVTGINNVGGILGGRSDVFLPGDHYPEVRGCRSDVVINATGMAAGGIVGRGLRVIDCHARGSVSGKESTGGIGGDVSLKDIDAPTDGLLISGCSFRGKVTSDGSITGGIAGSAICEISDCSAIGDVTGVRTVGGIVGHGPDLVRGCDATGNVLAAGNASGEIGHFAGGIVGNVGRFAGKESDKYRRTVQDSHFSGTVAGANCVGGISGDSLVVTGCTANAQVSGASMVGGISGRSYYNREEIDLDYGLVEACAFTGSVTGSRHVGGISGTGFILRNCVSTAATVTGEAYVGGVAGSATNLLSCSGAEVTVRGSLDYTGGVAGLVRRTAVNCSADGTVEGRRYTGGVAGMVKRFGSESIEHSNFTELLKTAFLPILSGCSFSGTVRGDTFTGGVAGISRILTADCTFDGVVIGGRCTDEILGVSDTVTDRS